MSEKKLLSAEESTSSKIMQAQVSRRKFFSYAGLSASVLYATSCHKIPELVDEIRDHTPKNTVNLGSGDIGILNYAYALEQLEAAFYTRVMIMPYYNMTSQEKEYLTDIRDHEIAHREFFKNVLGSKAIGTLEVDFSTITFSSRDSVLETAKAFEDLGVSAYNGAGQLLENANYLLAAGKIVSVEARHAAAIRDLLSYGSFSDNVDASGLDEVRTPPEVLAIAGTYIKTKIIANNLPTS